MVKGTGRHALGLALLFVCFRIPSLVGWDEAFYVGQLTSLFADHDLLLQNDILEFQNPSPDKLRALTTTTESGALLNTFSIGPALLHSSYTWPFLMAARRPVLERLRIPLALGSMAFLLLTAFATDAFLRRLGLEPDAAELATGLAILGGPLALYGTRSYLN